MKVEELRNRLEKLGIKTGFDSASGNLILMTKGFQKVGEVNHRALFDVKLNKHFERNFDHPLKQWKVISAIHEFIITPLHERGLTDEV